MDSGKNYSFIFAAGLLCAGLLCAAEKTTEIRTDTTTTTTTVRQTVRTEHTGWSPLKVCVMDFTSLDTAGQKRFLDEQNKPIRVPVQNTLNTADRKSINSIMQGFVRMIDAWDNTRTNTADRATQIKDNQFNRAKALDLYKTVVKGQSRPFVLGAEYLAAYLGRRSDVFVCLDSSAMSSAMSALQSEPGFPDNFMLRLAKKTGATHLIYGTVSDLRVKSNSFKGYGISTKTTDYQLDVLIKVVDLIRQHTVYSNVYTGNHREQKPVSGKQFDNGIYQKLMTSALEQAAEELYDISKPGRKNRISPAPLPYKLTVNPSGGLFFKPEASEVYIDGKLAGNGGGTFAVPVGKHEMEIRAAGYRTKKMTLNVSADSVINANLEK